MRDGFIFRGSVYNTVEIVIKKATLKIVNSENKVIENVKVYVNFDKYGIEDFSQLEYYLTVSHSSMLGDLEELLALEYGEFELEDIELGQANMLYIKRTSNLSVPLIGEGGILETDYDGGDFVTKPIKKCKVKYFRQAQLVVNFLNNNNVEVVSVTNEKNFRDNKVYYVLIYKEFDY